MKRRNILEIRYRDYPAIVAMSTTKQRNRYAIQELNSICDVYIKQRSGQKLLQTLNNEGYFVEDCIIIVVIYDKS